MTAKIIKKHRAEAYVMVTVHNARQARFYHDNNKDLMFSAFVLTKNAFEEYEKAGVPWSHMIAYIGSQAKVENKELIDLLHTKGVMCMISAAPSYDKLPDSLTRRNAYRDIIRSGADIIESDLPIEVGNALGGMLPSDSNKSKYFSKKNN
jgi:glycerophosphoryl diester phosphodiesterase